MGATDFAVGVVGALVLAHAAYSTVLCLRWMGERTNFQTHRSEEGALKIREEEFVRPPLQVLIEVVFSLVLCIWAAIKVPGTFLPILPDSKGNRVVALPANLDFMTFNHRGKLFPPELEAKFMSS